MTAETEGTKKKDKMLIGNQGGNQAIQEYFHNRCAMGRKIGGCFLADPCAL